MRAGLKGAVCASVDIVGGPKLTVWPSRPDFVAPAAEGVEEKRRAPAVHYLAMRIEGRVLIGQET